jgi:ABC-type methionine transport system permease subunit
VAIMPDPRVGPETALNAVRLLPVAIVLAILAAHFYRAQAWVPFGVTVGLAPLLFVRAPWAARVLQAALALGALEWLRTAAALVALRQSMGQPWTRLALILGAVALATAACALIFQWRPVRERFRVGKAGHPGP